MRGKQQSWGQRARCAQRLASKLLASLAYEILSFSAERFETELAARQYAAEAANEPKNFMKTTYTIECAGQIPESSIPDAAIAFGNGFDSYRLEFETLEEALKACEAALERGEWVRLRCG